MIRRRVFRNDLIKRGDQADRTEITDLICSMFLWNEVEIYFVCSPVDVTILKKILEHS